MPRRRGVFPPRRVSGGDVRAHDEVALFTGDEVECQEIGGPNLHGLDLKVSVFRLPEKGNTALMRICCLRRNHAITGDVLWILVVG